MKKAIVGKKIGMTQVFSEDGRLKPLRYTRISRGAECEPARKAGLFFGRGLIRTVVCIRVTKGFIRTHKDGANAVTKNVRKGEKHPWQQQRT